MRDMWFYCPKTSMGMVKVHTISERIREVIETSGGSGVSDSQ